MTKMFKIIAEIEINALGGRNNPVKSGYRPGFIFIGNSQTSGMIRLINKTFLNPGGKGIAEIFFNSDELLGEITKGCEFHFYEGPCEIGKGKVVNNIGWVDFN